MSCALLSDCDLGISLYGERMVAAILFLVTLPAVAKSQSHAQGHDSKGGSHQDSDRSAKGLLPILRSGRGRTVAHRAALCERRDHPQAQNSNQQGNRTPYRMHASALHRRSHLTPNERMRKASGKNTIIMARQNTSAHMVSHFMRDTSYFMCMK